jgi:hypothetical protein
MIRDLTQADIGRLEQIHSGAGIDYSFPCLDSPLFINRIVSASGGKIVAAGLHKVCYETFVLVDPNARPQEKWAALREVNDELSTRAYRQGLDLTHASVPPIGFDKRLLQLGWSKDRENWALWSRETNALCR